MTKVDRDALELAMKLIRHNPLRAEQIDSKLKDEPWEKVAKFAADVLQFERLHLKPWHETPAFVDEDNPPARDREAAQLCRRMLALGISRYDPDPLGAVEAAEAARPDGCITGLQTDLQ